MTEPLPNIVVFTEAVTGGDPRVTHWLSRMSASKMSAVDKRAILIVAAENDRIEVLEWLLRKWYRDNDPSSFVNEVYWAVVCDFRYGLRRPLNLVVLRWMADMVDVGLLRDDAVEWALYKSADIVQWLETHMCVQSRMRRYMSSPGFDPVLGNMHLVFLPRLRGLRPNPELDAVILRAAVSGGKKKAVRALRDNPFTVRKECLANGGELLRQCKSRKMLAILALTAQLTISDFVSVGLSL